MSTRLRWSLEHTSDIIEVSKEERIVRAIIVDNAIELRSSHLPLATHYLKLILIHSITLFLGLPWVYSCSCRIMHCNLLGGMKSCHRA
jgi:hypothetical protein